MATVILVTSVERTLKRTGDPNTVAFPIGEDVLFQLKVVSVSIALLYFNNVTFKDN